MYPESLTGKKKSNGKVVDPLPPFTEAQNFFYQLTRYPTSL